MRTGTVLTLLAVTVAMLSGCAGADSEAGSGRTVVAAFYPIAYAAERLDPAARVDNLTPAGAEPHDIELSARDVVRVRDADTVLYFGHGFMPALEQAVEGRDNAVDLLAGQPLLKGGAAAVDPHVWLDPVRYAAIVRKIADALGRGSADADLLGDLDDLAAEYRTGLAHCERRELVTSHAAFAYLAQRYGLEQVPLTGITPEAEPTAKALQGLVDEVKRSGTTTVFFETLVSPKLAQTVAREAGVRSAVLDPLEGLTKAEIAKGADYFSVMRANLTALRKALGCR